LAPTSGGQAKLGKDSSNESEEQAQSNPSLLDLMLKPQLYEGKTVSVTGMVYRDDSVPPN